MPQCGAFYYVGVVSIIIIFLNSIIDIDCIEGYSVNLWFSRTLCSLEANESCMQQLKERNSSDSFRNSLKRIRHPTPVFDAL